MCLPCSGAQWTAASGGMSRARVWAVALVLAAAVAALESDVSDDSVCSSPIYCQGDLLHVVQTSMLFQDSKTFVDMKLRISVNETLRNFMIMMDKSNNRPRWDDIQNFVENHFLPEDELEPANLTDWVEKPPAFNKIADPEFREWAYDLNRRWKNLAKKVSEDVRESDGRTSLLYIPNRFIVPGGRFKEQYYWDTFWIVRGLLLSGMKETARGIIENFLHLLRQYKIIPNGTRIYYRRRSQPPLLIPMMDAYVAVTGDSGFLEENIELLEREFAFWITNRAVEVQKYGRNYTLFRYYSRSKGPRPESYREDYQLAKYVSSEEKRQQLYFNIKAAAESGWDFSSRWFMKNGTNYGNLSNLDAINIIPVDLNAILYKNAVLLSKFYSNLGKVEKVKYYIDFAWNIKEAINNLLWNDEKGSWFDYDMLHHVQRINFYASNMVPLWTKCFDDDKTSHVVKKVVKYLENSVMMNAIGGIPQSTEFTGEQWDFPNAWPPSQHFIIFGLDQTKTSNAQEFAFMLAKKWISSNYQTYKKLGHMYEKYDARCIGKYGGGGEYVVQLGFGWTNGVILELLHKYGEKLTANDSLRRSYQHYPRRMQNLIRKYSAECETKL